MNITAHQSNIRTIRQGDPKFTLKDGFVISPRAGFEINQRCPREYKLIISECINNGWLKPVAHVYGKELTMDALR
jgi:hypothetical protein